MQSDHTVATINGGEGLGVIASLGVEGVVPGVADASGGFDKLSQLLVDGQVQGDHTVAAVHGLERHIIVASLREDGAMEVVRGVLTDSFVVFGLQVRPHGQRHRGGAVATIDVLAEARERIDARLGEGGVEAVGLVGVASADLVGQRDRARRIHREVEHDGTVTAIAGGHDARASGVASRSGSHVEAVQLVALAQAERGIQLGGVQLMDDEVQHGDAVAAVMGRALLGVVAGLRDIRKVEVIFGVVAASAGVSHNRVAVFGTDRQVQHHDAVAAVGGGQFGDVGAGLRQGLSVEFVATVLADHLRDAVVVGRPHAQVQGGGAVAAIDVLVEVRQRVVAGLGEGGVKSVQGVGSTGADGVVEDNLMRGIHRDLCCHHAVAAERGVFVLRVGERAEHGSQHVEAVLVVTLTDAERLGEVGVGTRVYDEVQDRGAVATVDISRHVAVVLRLRGRENFKVVLGVAFAFAEVNLKGVALLGIDGQVQRHDAVAAVDGGQGVGVVAGLGQSNAVEQVGLIMADGSLDFVLEDRINGDVHGEGAVAAIAVLTFVSQRVAAGLREGGVEAELREGLASAEGRVNHKVVYRIHRQVQGDGAVAAVAGFEMAGVVVSADHRVGNREAVVGVGALTAERVVKLGDGGLVYEQVQDGDAVTAVG